MTGETPTHSWGAKHRTKTKQKEKIQQQKNENVGIISVAPQNKDVSNFPGVISGWHWGKN